MRRLIPVILLLVAASSFAQFRYTTWGMTVEEVKSAEDAELLIDKDQYLLYGVILLGQKVLAHYVFENNQLVSASYDSIPLSIESRVIEELDRRYEPDRGSRQSGGAMIWNTEETLIGLVSVSSTFSLQYMSKTAIERTREHERQENADAPL